MVQRDIKTHALLANRLLHSLRVKRFIQISFIAVLLQKRENLGTRDLVVLTRAQSVVFETCRAFTVIKNRAGGHRNNLTSIPLYKKP